MSILLQYSARVDQNVASIFEGLTSDLILNLDDPLLACFYPSGANDTVTQADILAKIVVVCHFLKVGQNFRSSRVAVNESLSASIGRALFSRNSLRAPNTRCPRELVVDRGDVASTAWIFILEPSTSNFWIFLVTHEVDIKFTCADLVCKVECARSRSNGNDLEMSVHPARLFKNLIIGACGKTIGPFTLHRGM